MRKQLILVCVAVVLSVLAGGFFVANAQTRKAPIVNPIDTMLGMGGGSAAMALGDRVLYVLVGRRVYKIETDTMEVVKELVLPSPFGVPGKKTTSGK